MIKNSSGVNIHALKKLNKMQVSPRRKDFRYRFAQLLTLVLIMSISVNSTLAASNPQTILASLVETSQDIHFKLKAADFGTVLGDWASNFLLFFSSNKAESLPISRIEIRPGRDLNIRQNEPVNFTATAYTSEGIAIGGLKFDWTVQDVGRSLSPHNLANGILSAQTTGNFVVTAQAGGVQARVNVTVQENRGLTILKKILDNESRGINLDQINILKTLNIYRSANINSKLKYRPQTNQEVLRAKVSIESPNE